MTDFIQKYAAVWNDNPLSLMKEFDYLPLKTEELDTIKKDSFNREKLYEIILWKLNRLPEIADEIIEKIKTIFDYKPGEHRKAGDILKELLSTKVDKRHCVAYGINYPTLRKPIYFSDHR